MPTPSFFRLNFRTMIALSLGIVMVLTVGLTSSVFAAEGPDTTMENMPTPTRTPPPYADAHRDTDLNANLDTDLNANLDADTDAD